MSDPAPHLQKTRPARLTGLALGTALSALLAVPAPALAQSAPSASATPPTLHMLGQGTIDTAPDMATITTGVVTQAKTAKDALAANTKAMSALTASLEGSGIASSDMQTSQFSVDPLYSYPQPPAPGQNAPPPQLTGYQVSNSLTLKVRKLDELGDVLDKMVSAGANRIDNLAFSLANNDAAMTKARRAAFTDAQSKAKTYADAAGLCLVRITGISELSDQMPTPIRMERMAMADSAPVPIRAGQVSANVQVQVTWEIGAQPCAKN